MLQDVLRSIGGVGMYGVISISIFFTFFLGMLIWALRLKGSYVNAMRQLPLEETTESKPTHPKDSRYE